MLERLLSALVEAVAGKYVEGLDAKATQLSIWNGHLYLKDLRLKPSALDQLDLPIRMKYGFLQEMTLDISWKNLLSKPLVVQLNGIYLIASPNLYSGCSASERQIKALESKRAMLGELDSRASSLESELEGKDPDGGLTSVLARKIVENMQLKISNIHIRYEDELQDVNHPFSAGLMLKALTLESTNANWKPSNVEDERILYKAASMQGLSLYLNADDCQANGTKQTLSEDPTQHVDEEMNDVEDRTTSMLGSNVLMIMMRMVQDQNANANPSNESEKPLFVSESLEDQGRECLHQTFVVKSLDGSLHLMIRRAEFFDNLPKYEVELEIPSICFHISKPQFRDIVRTLNFLDNRERIVHYAQFRPQCNVMECPKAWWLYAFKCVSWEQAQAKRRFDKQEMRRILGLWPKYLSLYKRRFATVLGLPPLDFEEASKISKLEDELPYEAIAVAREKILRELRQHGIQKTFQSDQEMLDQNASRGSGIFQNVKNWFGFSQKGESHDSAQIMKKGVKNFMKQFLHEIGVENQVTDLVDKDPLEAPHKLLVQDVPDRSEQMDLKLRCSLKHGSFSVASNIADGNSESTIANLEFRSLQMAVILFPGSADIEFQLGDFKITDLLSRNLSQDFDLIVSRVERGPASSNKAAEGISSTPAKFLTKYFQKHCKRQKISLEKREIVEQPLLWFKYQSHPPEKQVDSVLSLNLDSMLFVYNTTIVRALLEFADVGGSPAIERMTTAAKQQIEDVRKQSRKSIELALASKLVCDLSIKLQSPIILIPENRGMTHRTPSVIIFQPGNLSVWSIQSHLHETSKLLRTLVAADKGDETYYNSVVIELDSLSVELCNILEYRSGDIGAGARIFNDVRISAFVQNSILPNNPDLTRTKVKIALPSLDLHLSFQKIARIQSLISSVLCQDENASKEEIRSWQSSAKEQEAFRVEGESKFKLLDLLISVAPSSYSGNARVMLRLLDESSAEALPLADFILQDLSTSVATFRDGSFTSDVRVGNVIILDSRHGVQNKFRKILEANPNSSRKELSQILPVAIQMEATASGQRNIVVRLVAFKFMVIPDFLCSVLHSYNLAFECAGGDRCGDPGASFNQRSADTEVISDCLSSCHVFVIDSLIRLFDDEDDESSQSITLRTSAMVKHDQYSDGSMAGKIHFQDVSLTCKLLQSLQERVLLKREMNLSLEYSILDRVTKIALLCPVVDLHISFQDIKLAKAIWVHMMEAYESEASSTDMIGRLQGSDESHTLNNSTETQYRLDISCFTLSVFNDCKGFHESLGHLDFEAFSADLSNAGNDTRYKVKGRVQLFLYNSEVHDFEPIVEDWGCAVEYAKNCKEICICSDSEKSSNIPNDISEDESVCLFSDEILNINLTEHHVLHMMRILYTWQEELLGQAVVRPKHWDLCGANDCEINNRCGISMSVRGSWADEGIWLAVPPSGTTIIPLFSSFSSYEQDDKLVDTSSILYLSASLCSSMQRDQSTGVTIPLQIDGATIHSTPGGGEFVAMVRSGQPNSRLVITFQSHFSFDNSTEEDLDVQLVDPNDVCWCETYTVTRRSVFDFPPNALCNRCQQNVVIAIRRVSSAGSPSDRRHGWSQYLTVKRGLDVVVAADSPDQAALSDFNTEINMVEVEKFFARVSVNVRDVMIPTGSHFKIFTIKVMPIFAVTNLLPCPVRFSLWVEGKDAPMPSFCADSGEDVSVHSVDLLRKLSIGIALQNLEDSSEFVPIFAPEGVQLERHITIFDSEKNCVRLCLLHEQEPDCVFKISIYAPYWIVNRTSYPITIAQKWTASSVTVVGGQRQPGTDDSVSENDDQNVSGQIQSRVEISVPHSEAQTHVDVETVLSRPCAQALPRIFSFGPKTDLGGNKACIRLGDPYMRFSSRQGRQVPCEWSNPFRIDVIGSAGELQLVAEDFSVEITYNVSSAGGRFDRTKVVTLLPRQTMYNFLHCPVSVGQVGCEDISSVILQRNEAKVVCWRHESKERRLKFRLSAENDQHEMWYWTEPIPLSDFGYSPLKMRSCQSGNIFNMMVEVTWIDRMTVLTLREYDLENPTMKIVNHSAWVVLFYRQHGTDECLEEKLEPRKERSFCWDNPHYLPHIMTLRVGSGGRDSSQIVECDMDRLGTFPDVSIDGRSLKISVEAHGPTKILELRDQEDQFSTEQSPAASSTPHVDIRKPTFQLVIQLAGVGISVIDHTPQELLYATFGGIMIRSVMVDTWHMLEFRVRKMQIDNQTNFGNPVLLCSAAACIPGYRPKVDDLGADTTGSVMRNTLNNPSFDKLHDSDDHLVLKFNRTFRNPSVDCYEFFQASVLDMAADIDEGLLISLINGCKGLVSQIWNEDESEKFNVWTLGVVDLSVISDPLSMAKQRWIYIQSLQISSLRLYITFHGSENARGLINNQILTTPPFAAMLDVVKALIINIDRAPLVFYPVELSQPFFPQHDFKKRILKHYRNCLLKGIYRLVGSLEFLGNPAGLMSDIGAGIQGALESSREGIKEGRLGWGLASGAGTLAAGTVQGIFGSTAGLSSSVGKALAQLTFDGNYKRARALMEQNKPIHIGEGLWKGGYYLGSGVAEGLKGVIKQPLHGYNKEGAKGAIKGVCKGLIGMIVKPLAGLTDLLTQTSEGIRNTPQCLATAARQSQEPSAGRVRFPRRWQNGRPVTKFDSRSALAAALLAQLSYDYGWTEDEAPLDYIAWTEQKTSNRASESSDVVTTFWIILTAKRLIFCQHAGYGLQIAQIRLITSASWGSVLQISNKPDGIYVLGVEENAGPATSLSLNLRAKLGLPAPGGDVAALERSGGRVGVLNGRLVYALRFRPKQEKIRQWLLARLRMLVGLDESQLVGEDWVLVQRLPDGLQSRPPNQRQITAFGSSSRDEGIWHVLDGLSAQVVSAEPHRLHQWDEYHEYRILCRLTSTTDEVDASDQVSKSWTVHRRFREFVQLRKQLCSILVQNNRRGRHTGSHEDFRSWLPAIPFLPKQKFFGRNSPDILQARTWALDLFLYDLLEMCHGHSDSGQRPPVAFARAVAKFLMCLADSNAGP